MPDYFWDTSAICKHYRAETGTAKVDVLLTLPGYGHAISRLGSVEFHSTFAKKFRTGVMSRREVEAVTRNFRADIVSRRYRLIRVTVPHFKTAERLIRRIGFTQNLRTLDALQLAVALSLNDPADPITFVCADQALCAVAASEGLPVVNPEVP